MILPPALSILHFILLGRDADGDRQRWNHLCLEQLLQKKMERRLLRSLVPSSIGKRLCAGEQIVADRHENATVLFIYVDQYEETLLSCGTTRTIRWLNEIFCKFDKVLGSKSNVIKVETNSNFYLAVSGITRTADTGQTTLRARAEELHSQGMEQCVLSAIRMISGAHEIKRPNKKPTSLRVGLSSGPLSSGVVGNAHPRFSIFGDTVNTASRMASSSEVSVKWRPVIHMSASSECLLTTAFIQRMDMMGWRLGARGHGMEIKGKGIMQTYTLTMVRDKVAKQDSH